MKLEVKWKHIIYLLLFYSIVSIICLNFGVVGNIVIEIILIVIFGYINRIYIFKILDFVKDRIKKCLKN